jgi:hypothetical protein
MNHLMLPPFICVADLQPTLQKTGYALLAPSSLMQWLNLSVDALQHMTPIWDDLPADQYLKDGGRYRRRRHACFVVNGDQVSAVPHRPHWQPLEYNALHGGLERWFDPLAPDPHSQLVWGRLLPAMGRMCSALKSLQPWFVEAHVFRIDTTDGIGRPTPEGAHRDGVDFVAVMLIQRHNIKGGETRVFEAQGPNGQRFTLTEPWSTLLLDDERVIHESTPIQPLDAAEPGYRDTLVLTLRAGGFQGPSA